MHTYIQKKLSVNNFSFQEGDDQADLPLRLLDYWRGYFLYSIPEFAAPAVAIAWAFIGPFVLPGGWITKATRLLPHAIYAAKKVNKLRKETAADTSISSTTLAPVPSAAVTTTPS